MMTIWRVVTLRLLTRLYVNPYIPYENFIFNPLKRFNVKLVVLIILLTSSYTYVSDVGSHTLRCKYINVSSHRCSSNTHYEVMKT